MTADRGEDRYGRGPGGTPPAEIIGVTPFGRPGPRLAVAVARAGGLGVLDLGTDRASGLAALDEVVRWWTGPFGVRVPAGCRIRPEELPDAVSTVIVDAPVFGAADRSRGALGGTPEGVAGGPPRGLPGRVSGGGAPGVPTDASGDGTVDVAGFARGRRLLVEVVDPAEAAAALNTARAVEGTRGVGLIARGREAGGRVGEPTTFVLLQHLLALDVPVHAAGGIGPRTAAAAVAGGAAGVVLDVQLALVRETELPAAISDVLTSMDGSETTVVAGHRVYAHADTDASDVSDVSDRADAAESAEADARHPSGPPARPRPLPVGQDGPLAASLAARYKTAGGVVHAVRESIAEHVRAAVRARPLAPRGGPHGGEYPVVQAPMTQISDTSTFAAAVAQDGGVPFLALGPLDAGGVADLLSETADRLGGRPWGVGMVGFVPPELRAEQLAAVRAAAPTYAIVSGGSPEQAAPLEEVGTRTYLHVSAPDRLDRFLAEGARRFVFEGMECGGHVGPRASFPLWEAQLERLEAFCAARPDEAGRLSVLFAGGIHDERSAAMVAALAGPVAERGVDVRVLMGTAYLFTSEAVAAGAVQPGYQETAIACAATALLETSPGLATRCARTRYVRTFEGTRTELRGTGMPPQETYRRLERLNLARLRIASKGLRRSGPVDADEQRDEGLYMIGQAATLRSAKTGIPALHEQVTTGATELLAARAAELGLDGPGAARGPARPADIAIVGLACVFPGARNADEYWANVLGGADAVTEVGHWDAEIYQGSPEDGRTPSKWGGFLPDIPFDAEAHGVPADALGSIDPAQLLSLEVASRALADAGYGDRVFDRARTSVIFGAEGGGDLAAAYALRAALPGYLGEVPPELDEQLPHPTPESLAGVQTGVIAGRVAARFGLGGVARTVAAASASSLAALDTACTELAAGGSDMVLCGGADLRTGVQDYLAAAAAGTLSPSGRCAPFDAGADGTVPGEGVACVVLKRLADAERDGDRIYAVVKSVGGSRADGPRHAYARAGVPPERVGLVEATEAAEQAALAPVFAGAAPGAVTLGSVTSQIGHTGCAAGLAGLVKTAYALHAGVLPGTLHLDRPNEAWDADGPFAFGASARPWAVPPGDRHAGVAGSGFGGTHHHAVLSGYGGAPEPVSGLAEWPAELFVIRAGTDVERLRRLASSGHRLRDLARTVASDEGPVRAAFAATGTGDLRERLADLGEPAERDPGQVAFLFPGLLGGRPGTLADLFVAFPRLQRLLRLGRDYVPAMFPPAAFTPADVRRQRDALADPRVAQPVLGLAGLAVHRLLTAVGVHPDLAAGHGHGEVVALCAAGVFDDADLIELSAARADAVLAAGDDPGTMAVVVGGLREVRDALSGVSDISVAAENAPREVVIAGTSAGIARALDVLAGRDLAAERLPAACALHSPLVAAASGVLRTALTGRDLRSPAFPVWSGATAEPYDTEPADLAAALAGQLAAPVRFADQIEAMYAAGARTFVEAGPGGALTGHVRAILGDRPHTSVTCDDTGGLPGLLRALAVLAAAGVPVDPLPLFAGRDARPVDAPAPAPAWYVNGHLVKTADGGRPTNALRPAARVEGGTMSDRTRRSDAAVLEYLRAGRELIAAQREVILRHLAGDTDPTAPPVPAPRPILPGETLPDARVAVRAVVAARTGHPESLLTDDVDLVADLGIEPTARAALLDDLAARAGVAAPGESFAAGTIGEIADWLDGLLNPAPVPTAHVGTSALSGGPTPPSPRPPAEPVGAGPRPGGTSEHAAFADGAVVELVGREGAEPRPDGVSEDARFADGPADELVGREGAEPRPDGVSEDARFADGPADELVGREGAEPRPDGMSEDASCADGAVVEPVGRADAPAWPDGVPEDAAFVDGPAVELVGREVAEPRLDGVSEDARFADGAADEPVAREVAEPWSDGASEDAGCAGGDAEAGSVARSDAERHGTSAQDGPDVEEPAAEAQDHASGGAAREEVSVPAAQEDLTSAANDASDVESVRVIPPGEWPRTESGASAGAARQPDDRRRGRRSMRAGRGPAPDGAADAPVEESVRVIPAGQRPPRDGDGSVRVIPAGERAGTESGASGEGSVRVIPPGERPAAGADDAPAQESVRVIPAGERSQERGGSESGMGGRVVDAPLDVVVAGAAFRDAGRRIEEDAPAERAESVEPPGVPAPAAEPRPAIVRHIVRDTPLEALPFPPESGTAFTGRRFTIVDDGCGVALELADVLERYGAQVRMPLEVDGACDGLVHLGALRPAGAAVLPEAYEGIRRALLGGLRWFVAAGTAGGTSGRRFGGGAGEPGPGAGLPGLARTVAREFPETMVRAVDVDTGETPRMIALRIMAELLAADGPVVARYDGDRRRTPSPVAEELDGEACAPVGPDGVVLLTGGARGVSAQVARGLVRAAGCHVEIIGRMPEPVGRTVFSEALDEVALRRALVADGTRGPEEIEETIRRILAEREVQENLDALRVRAASVRYHAGDVRDARFVRNVIEDVYVRHGRLDGVVHGAGVAEDRLVRDKSPESFERAYRTKVDGASALAASVRPEIGFFVVLGAAEDRMPADRAAADDACEALARVWRTRLDGRVLVADLAPGDPATGPGDPEPAMAALFREIAHGGETRVVFTGAVR